MKDHLGNTRVTFGKRHTSEYIATMETDDPDIIQLELLWFENIAETRHTDALMNHTNGGTKTALTNTSQIIGPAMNLYVNPGDTVWVEVYAGYLNGINGGQISEALLTDVLAATFGGFNGGGPEAQFIYDFISDGLAGFTATSNGSDNVPEAYLNYILFDASYNPLDGGFIPISSEADMSDDIHQLISLPTLVIDTEGFLYVYTSNETATDIPVYWDDLKVTHSESEIIQTDDYYPFGGTLAGTSYQRLGAQENKFKFQGQELQDDLDLNWYQFKWRMHDPAIGRFMVVDPLAEDYYYNSPYAFAENRVIDGVELEGLEWIGINSLALKGVGIDNPTGGLNTVINSTKIEVKGTISFDEGVRVGIKGVGEFATGYSEKYSGIESTVFLDKSGVGSKRTVFDVNKGNFESSYNTTAQYAGFGIDMKESVKIEKEGKISKKEVKITEGIGVPGVNLYQSGTVENGNLKNLQIGVEGGGTVPFLPAIVGEKTQMPTTLTINVNAAIHLDIEKLNEQE